MLAFTLVVMTGMVVGLVVRRIIGDHGYGRVADALLGITGALAAAWAIRQSELSWSWRANFMIWAAAFLPYLAHVRARGRTRIAYRQARQERTSK